MRTLLLSLGCFLVCSSVLSAQSKTLQGEIDGALFQIAVPAEPTGDVLLLAHGFRPPSLPRSADFGSTASLYEDLVAQGWIVASSSYRRNGWIMEDAADDLIKLRDHIAKTVMEPKRTFLAGNSMGGGIVTWLAENRPDGFAGGLAMGAYLFGPIEADQPRSTALSDALPGKPAFPLLFLTNHSELDGPASYLSRAAGSAVPPVLWRVDRVGHVNLNGLEQAAAFEALLHWVETGEIDRGRNATIVARPTSTATAEDGKVTGHIRHLVPVYGNFIASFVLADLEALGLKTGDSFALTAGGETVPVYLGQSYEDVPVGDWVAFPDADGYLLICRNYAHAVNTLGVAKGDAVVIAVD